MNKISIYILLIFIYLGLSKSLSPTEQRTPSIKDHWAFSSFFKSAPITVVLVDAFETGFLIKTYFHKYIVLHAFKTPKTTIVRVSKKFFDVNAKNLGMSLFRRKDSPDSESSLPIPPGFMYVGDPLFGRWQYKDSGTKIWSFHRAYRHFPETFGWIDFSVSHEFYKKIKQAFTDHQVFYGTNNEFGTNGSVTKKYLNNMSFNTRRKSLTEQTKNHLLNFMSLPWGKK